MSGWGSLGASKHGQVAGFQEGTVRTDLHKKTCCNYSRQFEQIRIRIFALWPMEWGDCFAAAAAAAVDAG